MLPSVAQRPSRRLPRKRPTNGGREGFGDGRADHAITDQAGRVVLDGTAVVWRDADVAQLVSGDGAGKVGGRPAS